MQQAEKLKMQAAQERDRAEQLEQMLRKLRKESGRLDSQESRNWKAALAARHEGKQADPEHAQTALRISPEGMSTPTTRSKHWKSLLRDGDYKATIDTRSNSLIIQGPPEMLDKLKAVIEKSVDVKPAESAPATDKLELAVIPLKHIDAKAAQDALAKTLGPAKVSYRASSIPAPTRSSLPVSRRGAGGPQSD